MEGLIVEKDILRQLEVTRKMMIDSGLQNGLLNKKTLRLSEQVDRLINAFDANKEKELNTKQFTTKIIQ